MSTVVSHKGQRFMLDGREWIAIDVSDDFIVAVHAERYEEMPDDLYCAEGKKFRRKYIRWFVPGE